MKTNRKEEKAIESALIQIARDLRALKCNPNPTTQITPERAAIIATLLENRRRNEKLGEGD
jgi:hypothetical protein